MTFSARSVLQDHSVIPPQKLLILRNLLNFQKNFFFPTLGEQFVKIIEDALSSIVYPIILPCAPPTSQRRFAMIFENVRYCRTNYYS